ncbi:hypothetical protein MJH12_08400 [bacterium]|nr:hypothetical protein [bacterium]
MSSLLSFAVNKIDPSLSLDVKIAPNQLLLYKISMNIEDFSFRKLGGGEAAIKLKKLLFEVRKSLIREGVEKISLRMAIPLKLHKSAGGKTLISGIMEYSTLDALIHLKDQEDSAKEKRVNSLIQHLIKPLSMDRFAPMLLKNLESRYLGEGLQVGKLLVLKSKDLDKNRKLWIEVNLGGVNALNPLAFTSFSTDKKKLKLVGEIR